MKALFEEPSVKVIFFSVKEDILTSSDPNDPGRQDLDEFGGENE